MVTLDLNCQNHKRLDFTVTCEFMWTSFCLDMTCYPPQTQRLKINLLNQSESSFLLVCVCSMSSQKTDDSSVHDIHMGIICCGQQKQMATCKTCRSKIRDGDATLFDTRIQLSNRKYNRIIYNM